MLVKTDQSQTSMVGLCFVSSSLRRIVQVLLKSEHYPNLKPFFFPQITNILKGPSPSPTRKMTSFFCFKIKFSKKDVLQKVTKSFCLIYVICQYISIFFLVFFLFLLEIDGRFLYVIITNDPQVTTGNRSSLAWAWHRWNERVSRGHQVHDIRGQQGDTRVI